MAIEFDNPNEREVFHARESNVPLVLGMVPVVLVGALAGVVANLLGYGAYLGWIVLATVVVALASRVPMLIRNLSTDVVVTDRRLYYRTGLVNIKDHVTELSNIADVTIDPSVAGRVFNYADVKIQTVAGEEDFDFHQIARAYDLRRAISAGGDAERDRQARAPRRR